MITNATDPITPLAYISAEHGGIAHCLFADLYGKLKKKILSLPNPALKHYLDVLMKKKIQNVISQRADLMVVEVL